MGGSAGSRGAMSSAFDSVHSGRSGATDLLSRQGEDGAATARFIDGPADETRQRKADAVTLLTVYLFLLMAIPAPLVLAPLGGAGGPATIFAALLLGCYLLTLIHPALALDRGPQPIRVAAMVLTCAVIATYISANRRTLPGLEQNGADRGLIIMLGWLGVMLLAADGIPSMARLKTLLGRVIFGATAMASLAIVQFFTGLNASQYIVIPGLTTQTPFTDLLTRDQLNRPSATAIDPIELAVVLAVCLVIAVHRARFAPDGNRVACGGGHRAPAHLAEVGPAGRLRGRAGGHSLPVRDEAGPARRVPEPLPASGIRHQQRVTDRGLLRQHAVHHAASVARPRVRHLPAGDVLLHRRSVSPDPRRNRRHRPRRPPGAFHHRVADREKRPPHVQEPGGPRSRADHGGHGGHRRGVFRHAGRAFVRDSREPHLSHHRMLGRLVAAGPRGETRRSGHGGAGRTAGGQPGASSSGAGQSSPRPSAAGRPRPGAAGQPHPS